MTKMTPRENKWLEEYRRREAAKTIRMQRRALWFWGALFTTWAIFGLFAEPDKFTFTDSLLLIMILVNVFNSIKELIRNKRIAAEKKMQPKLRKTPRSLNRQNLKTKIWQLFFHASSQGRSPRTK